MSVKGERENGGWGGRTQAAEEPRERSAQGAAPVQMLLLEKFYTFEKWEDLIGMFCSAFGWTLPEKCMISAHILRQINEADK